MSPLYLLDWALVALCYSIAFFLICLFIGLGVIFIKAARDDE